MAQPTRKLTFAQRSMVRKEKNTVKMKPHRVWKPFQVAPGQSIKTITNYQGNNFLQLTFCFQQLRCLILAARGFGVALKEILRARDPVSKFS